MINLKRTIRIHARDHSHYCQHHCALCKSPCEKKGRYPSPGDPPQPALPTPVPARVSDDVEPRV